MKHRVSALASAALTYSLLTACGSTGPNDPNTPPATAPAAPLPTVTVTAPEAANVGIPFTITWSASRADSCAADFDAQTTTQASAVVTATTAGVKTFSVTCTGVGGSVTNTATVTLSLPTAEGLWNGTSGSRAISAVVTREGAYWLLYSAPDDPATPSGFYAGTGSFAPDTASPSTGSFPSADLREFNFEGGNTAAQGSLTSAYAHPSGGYTTASTLDGNFIPPTTVDHTYVVTATGSEYYAASGDLSVAYSGTWNGDTLEGNLTGVGTIGLYQLSADLSQTFKMTPATGKGVLRQAAGSTGTCLDTIGGGVCAGLVGNFKGALYNNIAYAGGANNYTATATPFTVGAMGGSYVWGFLIQTSQTTDPDTGDISTYYGAYHLNVTMTPQTMPPIAAGAFSSHYDPLYEVTPSLAALAGSYTGTAGIVNSTAGGATFVATSDGSITGVAGACQYTATTVVHPSGGNVYDVLSLSFDGGGCAYAGSGTFTGVVRYDGDTHQAVLTAINSARDKGFMFVGTKP